ncbi:hypothetical protein MTO96_036605 [Rhipicephalus appendiculatus]
MMCSSTCAMAEEARLERLTAHGCATVCSAVDKDVAANPAVWDRNFRGPGSGHDPRRPHQVGLVHEPGPGYCTLAGATQQASSLDLGGGHWNWTLVRPPELDLAGTSCPIPASGTPGQKLVFVYPRRLHPRVPARSPVARSFFSFYFPVVFLPPPCHLPSARLHQFRFSLS